MKLTITLHEDVVQMEINATKTTKQKQTRFKDRVDLQTTKYYHNLSEMLTPLEVTAIIRKGFITKDGTVIYKELLTGLINSLDNLLKRNKVDITTIKTYKILGNLGTDSTSYKIASAFIVGLQMLSPTINRRLPDLYI